MVELGDAGEHAEMNEARVFIAYLVAALQEAMPSAKRPAR